MLHRSKHWCVASNSTPERERRLLWFAERDDENEEEQPALGGVEFVNQVPVTGDAGVREEATASNSALERQREQTQEALREEEAARIAEETRRSTQEVVGSGDSAEANQTFSKLQERAQKIQESLTSSVTAMTELGLRVLAEMKSAGRRSWQDNLEFLRTGNQEMSSLQSALNILSAWESGNLDPEELAGLLDMLGMGRATPITVQDKMRDSPERAATEEVKRELFVNTRDAVRRHPEAANWRTKTIPNQLIAVQKIKSEVALREDDGQTHTLGDVLNVIKQDLIQQITTWEKALDMANEDVEKIKKQVAKIEQERGQSEGGRSLLESLSEARNKIPLKFYSLNEIWEAGTSVVNAYKESYKQYVQLRSAGLGKKMGKVVSWLPWGGDVEQILERELDERNDGIANKYEEYLKSRNASYHEIFNPSHGELSKNRHDGNRARGVLNYAAHRGWLFDIDLATKASDGNWGFRLIDGPVLSFKDLVPDDWEPEQINEAYSKLITAHNAGKKEESEKYKNRYHNIDSGEKFVELADKELGDHNIWAVKGIIERSIERGLEGEISPWHAVTIMRHIEEDPQLRRIITRDWLDQIGLLSIYRSAFMLGMYKADRKDIWAWLEKGDTNIENAGVMGKGIAEIKKDIKERTHLTFDTPDEQKELDRNVAKILAAQIVTIKDKQGREHHFTIFDNRYEFLRQHKHVKSQGKLDPGVGREDPDYFVGISENHWAGERPVAQIFARTGTGEFENIDNTMSYAGNIFVIHSKLENVNPVAADNYRKELGFKLSRWISQSPLGDSRAPGLEGALIIGGEKKGLPALDELIQTGFIDVEPIIRAIWSQRNGKDLARLLLTKDNAAFYKELETQRKKKDSLTKEKQDEFYWDLVARWRAKHPPITFVEPGQSVVSGTPVENPEPAISGEG